MSEDKKRRRRDLQAMGYTILQATAAMVETFIETDNAEGLQDMVLVQQEVIRKYKA